MPDCTTVAKSTDTSYLCLVKRAGAYMIPTANGCYTSSIIVSIRTVYLDIFSWLTRKRYPEHLRTGVKIDRPVTNGDGRKPNAMKVNRIGALDKNLKDVDIRHHTIQV